MKKAFTMIELVFILVIVGILASVALSRTDTSPLREAVIQLKSHILYTKHLAMKSDQYDNSDTEWYKGRWQLVLGKYASSNNQVTYTIFADTSSYGGDASSTEIAKNPLNPLQKMTGGYTGSSDLNISSSTFVGIKKMNLGYSYGVSDYNLTGGCSGARISFDHLGRPFRGDHSSMSSPYGALTQRLLTSDCNITISDSNGDSESIIISKETGYVKIQ